MHGDTYLSPELPSTPSQPFFPSPSSSLFSPFTPQQPPPTLPPLPLPLLPSHSTTSYISPDLTFISTSRTRSPSFPKPHSNHRRRARTSAPTITAAAPILALALHPFIALSNASRRAPDSLALSCKVARCHRARADNKLRFFRRLLSRERVPATAVEAFVCRDQSRKAFCKLYVTRLFFFGGGGEGGEGGGSTDLL